MQNNSFPLLLKEILLIAFLSVGISQVRAQSPSILPDVLHQYDNLPAEEYSITRSIDSTSLGYNSITCYRIKAGLDSIYSHYFVARNYSSNTSRVFYMPVIFEYDEGYIDRINDMKIFGNGCYFCGSRKYISQVYVSPFGNLYIYDSIGFMGYFDTPSLSSSSNEVHFLLG